MSHKPLKDAAKKLAAAHARGDFNRSRESECARLILNNPDNVHHTVVPDPGLDLLTRFERSVIVRRRRDILMDLWVNRFAHSASLELVMTPNATAPKFASGERMLEVSYPAGELADGLYEVVLQDTGGLTSYAQDTARGSSLAPWLHIDDDGIALRVRAIVAGGLVTFSVVPGDEPDLSCDVAYAMYDESPYPDRRFFSASALAFLPRACDK